jgi:hypothetical protein
MCTGTARGHSPKAAKVMKRVLTILGLAIFAVAAGVALIIAVQSNDAIPANDAVPGNDSLTVVRAISDKTEPTLQPIPGQPGWEALPTIPMYPGADWLHQIVEPSPTSRHVGYLLPEPVSPQEVEAWYRAYLLGHGWAMDGLQYIQNYSWVDKVGPVPWGLSLRVEAIARVVAGGVDVHLDIRRWPNVNKIPSHPDAQQVKVTFVPPPKENEGEMQVRVTTYITEAGPEEVGRYYKSVLAEHLWRADEKLQRPIDQAPGVVYHHWYGTMGGPEGANLYILAQPQPDGLTKVQLRVEVFNFGYNHAWDGHGLKVPLEK